MAFARRSVRLLPQVRLIRSQPSAVGPVPAMKGNRRRAEPVDDEKIIVGETMEVKFEKFPRRKKGNLLEDPSVMTLVKQHRVEIDENAEPKVSESAHLSSFGQVTEEEFKCVGNNNGPSFKVGYTDDELQLFDSIAEIKIDDALRNYEELEIFQHEVVKRLVALNASMYKWDKKPEILKKMLALNWYSDCQPKIEFLVQKCGVNPEVSSRASVAELYKFILK